MDENVDEEEDEKQDEEEEDDVNHHDLIKKKKKKKKKQKSAKKKEEEEMKIGRSVLQFGKTCSGKFNLDWRDSITDIQAFAVAVSTFQWSTKNR